MTLTAGQIFGFALFAYAATMLVVLVIVERKAFSRRLSGRPIYRWYSPIPGVPPFWVVVGYRYSDGREYRITEESGIYYGWRLVRR